MSPPTLHTRLFLLIIIIAPILLSPLNKPTPTLAKNEGVGYWVWANKDTLNQWVVFRKTFELPATSITRAVTAIAADTKYWLYLNGNLVVFEGGLKRGPNPHDTYYDELDLAPYLKPGKNTLAVLVWHFGKEGFSHKNSGRGGFYYESLIETSLTNYLIASDPSWRVKIHPGYKDNNQGEQPNVRLAESNIYYDAREAQTIEGWQTADFDHSSWEEVTYKGDFGAAPYGKFVKRPIPFFSYGELKAYANQADLPANGKATEIIKATLPSSLQITPYLQVEDPEDGAIIEMQTDFYTDGGANNLRSTYITKAGVQEFESLGWLSGTEVYYTIPARVRILGLKYRESGYATAFTGYFNSDQPFFNTLWQKSRRTMYLNMRDNYMDCSTRERAQWWGDVVHQMKQTFYSFDTNTYALTKKAIYELVNWKKPDGVLYSPTPSGNWFRELPAQMLAAIWSFWDYYLYTGDLSTVIEAYPTLKDYLKLWQLDADGLVVVRPGDLEWYDWGDNIDGRVILNAWYYLALDTAIKLAYSSNNENDVAEWQRLRASIADNFNRVFWNNVTNEYRSPEFKLDTDDRANALAVISGLAGADKFNAMAKVFSEHFNAGPYMEFYVLEALYKLNRPKQAEDRMRYRYLKQVEDPGYTLWEFWAKDGTLNHAWSGAPLYLLSAYNVGVRPLLPAYQSFQIVPVMGNFTKLNSLTPTIKGNIKVDLERLNPNALVMLLEFPQNTTANVGLPLFGMQNVLLKVNGVTVFENGIFTNNLEGVEKTGATTDYFYFKVVPGKWQFEVYGVNPVY
jgi:alpha-L-rhamnosidase